MMYDQATGSCTSSSVGSTLESCCGSDAGEMRAYFTYGSYQLTSPIPFGRCCLPDPTRILPMAYTPAVFQVGDST